MRQPDTPLKHNGRPSRPLRGVETIGPLDCPDRTVLDIPVAIIMDGSRMYLHTLRS